MSRFGQNPAASFAAVVVAAVSLAVPDESAGARFGTLPLPPDRSGYSPPVPHPVKRGFDMSGGSYAAGNRGLDYAVPLGSEVAAIAVGTVVFSGLVAGARWVTVLHPDGLRSSYGPLMAVGVGRGDTVGRGEALGRASGFLHLGVRRGGSYIDPAPLFSRRPRHAHLVASELSGSHERRHRRPSRYG